MWGARVRVQASRREFHTHIHLNYTIVEILSCIKKKKKLLLCEFLKNKNKNLLCDTLNLGKCVNEFLILKPTHLTSLVNIGWVCVEAHIWSELY